MPAEPMAIRNSHKQAMARVAPLPLVAAAAHSAAPFVMTALQNRRMPEAQTPRLGGK